MTGHVDITAPSGVEIKIRDDYKVIWINVDGICVCRICQPKHYLCIDAPNFKNEVLLRSMEDEIGRESIPPESGRDSAGVQGNPEELDS